MHELANVFIDRIVDRALEEDLSSGDVTTEACVDPSVQAVAHAVARTPLIACGAAVFARVWTRLDPQLRVEQHLADGARASRAAALWTVRGRARSILMGERVALNLTQRMCGVATATRLYVDAIPAGCATRITDTRKTTPGLRVLERYAVRTGGGYNHRDNLGAAVLIKDNHVVASGGVRQAILRAKQFASHTCKIECEVDTLEQLEEALEAGADIVLLDNMDTDTVIEAIRRTGSRAMLEASGGITLARVLELALAGIHAISVGALTHSTVASDIGLDFEAA
ncbi:MAG: carboxylating nicotinate-nucleotide diphosphorylase [Myxococcales bacterium]